MSWSDEVSAAMRNARTEGLDGDMPRAFVDAAVDMLLECEPQDRLVVAKKVVESAEGTELVWMLYTLTLVLKARGA